MGVLAKKVFNSQFKELSKFATNTDELIIKNEPMFFNSCFDYAYEKGGVITRSFLDNVPEDWKNQQLVFDSRVHMLMEGWYPCIPGWHHDDVPRDENTGQPDYENPKYKSEHILGLVNADVAPTYLASGLCTMPYVPENEIIYKIWHKEIEEQILNGNLTSIPIKDRTLVYIDCDTFHTGSKAIKNGWRWFGRVSKNTDRVKSITNEIRVNAQVYLEFPMQGW